MHRHLNIVILQLKQIKLLLYTYMLWLANRFIVYKLPRLSDSRHEVVTRGVGQMYMDVNSQHWKLLDKSIADKSGHAVYHTLQQIYSGYQSTVHMLRHFCLTFMSIICI